MSASIIDQFTDLPVTKQRKWQLRKQAAGKCGTCGQTQVIPFFCLKHAVGKREYERATLGSARRNTSKTYRLEAAALEAAR